MRKILLLAFLIIPCLSVHAQRRKHVNNDSKVSLTRGQLIYQKYCLTCHQADGGGVPGMNPPLSKTSYVLGDKNRLINIVLNGFATNDDIDGESYSNTMPAHNFLKDQEIADVLSYIRNNFSNKASMVSTVQVAQVRRKSKANITAKQASKLK